MRRQSQTNSAGTASIAHHRYFIIQRKLGEIAMNYVTSADAGRRAAGGTIIGLASRIAAGRRHPA